MYVKIVMTILQGLKSECSNFECCTTKCYFYNHDDGSCLIKRCPCDYDLHEIEKRVRALIEDEMKKEGEVNENAV